MFIFNPNASHMMPAHFGPRPTSSKSSGWYRDVTSMMIPYLTDRDALAQYFPENFTVGEQPIITIGYACNRDVDWLAGRGYNLISVSASAIYEGKREKLLGDFTLVMWENLTDPILTGRELQGIPKIFADIDDHCIKDGNWHTHASHFDNTFLDMNISELRAPTAKELEDNANARQGKDNPMGLRFFPETNGFGKAVNEATTFPSETNITEAYVGIGHINWHQMTWQQNPTQCHIINALAKLPILQYLPAIVMKGSTNLLVPERMPRCLV